jgi:hypothetical protein
LFENYPRKQRSHLLIQWSVHVTRDQELLRNVSASTITRRHFCN